MLGVPRFCNPRFCENIKKRLHPAGTFSEQSLSVFQFVVLKTNNKSVYPNCLRFPTPIQMKQPRVERLSMILGNYSCQKQISVELQQENQGMSITKHPHKLYILGALIYSISAPLSFGFIFLKQCPQVTLVHQVVDYACQVWSTGLKKNYVRLLRQYKKGFLGSFHQ